LTRITTDAEAKAAKATTSASATFLLRSSSATRTALGMAFDASRARLPPPDVLFVGKIEALADKHLD